MKLGQLCEYLSIYFVRAASRILGNRRCLVWIGNRYPGGRNAVLVSHHDRRLPAANGMDGPVRRGGCDILIVGGVSAPMRDVTLGPVGKNRGHVNGCIRVRLFSLC